jgi:hypothetical protein
MVSGTIVDLLPSWFTFGRIPILFTPACIPTTLARGFQPVEEAVDDGGRGTPALLLVKFVELGNNSRLRS